MSALDPRAYTGGDRPQTAPYDQRLARILVKPLVGIGLDPNVLTVFTAMLALAAALGFATGNPAIANWAATVFVLSRFLDHFDGELARQSGRASRLGYLLDYASGGVSYAALFAGIALGQWRGELGALALVLGGIAMLSAALAVFVNMALDRRSGDGGSVGYPRLAGFELEDGIYLLAPVTWLGGLSPFFVAASIGAVVYLAWSVLRLAWRPARRRSA